MAHAVRVRTDYSAAALRRLASAGRHANQSRRLLSLAAVLDGMSRADAARIGGMNRQTLRDWVHRFNEHGPEGLEVVSKYLIGATIGIRCDSFYDLAREIYTCRSELSSCLTWASEI